jgi:uncharacterized iron-regulated membrane protein
MYLFDVLILVGTIVLGFWMLSGLLLFAIGCMESLWRKKRPEDVSLNPKYEIVHDGSTWLAGLFASIVLGPIGLYAFIRDKWLDSS